MAAVRQRAAFENALNGLRHVQPAASEGRVERHDAVLTQPDHHLRTLVTSEIVPHQQDTQRGQVFGQGEGVDQEDRVTPLIHSRPCMTF